MPNLWVYGASNCTPWRLPSSEQCWTNILAESINHKLHLRSEEGCDNTFIYHKFISDLDAHSPDDLVVIAWSHPNRKTFVFDENNPLHQEQAAKGALVYQGDPIWFRSNNKQATSGVTDWLTLLPKPRGNQFFDTWFSNYHSEHEQRLNFGAYQDSTKIRSKCRMYQFYFSLESISGMDINCSAITYLEFVLKNKVWIEKDDLHCNAQGHQLLASQIKDDLGNL